MMPDTRMPILVVDDSRTMVYIIRNFLSYIGYSNIHQAVSGETALEMMRRQRFDLIISDWNMEPVSGYGLLLAARIDPRHAKVPFIMATANTRPDAIAAADEAGVTAILAKPFTARSLKAKVDAVLAAASKNGMSDLERHDLR